MAIFDPEMQAKVDLRLPLYHLFYPFARDRAVMPHSNPGCAKVVNLPRLVEPQKPLSFAIQTDDVAARAPLEAFIQQIFRQVYGAHIGSFYPALISIARPDGGFAAVAGFRSAAMPLFAEHYLDRPIELQLAKQGVAVVRGSIVEMGNLAPAGAGQARWLIAALTSFLYSAGFSWVIFTAVPVLHNAFGRMGIPLLTLAAARRSQLEAGLKDDWGSYYDSSPMVYAADIHASYRTLSRQIGPGMPRLQALWLQAQRAGYGYAPSVSEENRRHSMASSS